MPVKHLSDANPDGTVLGQSSSDLIGFYNATPVAQRAVGSFAAVSTTAPTTTTPYGFSTSTQAAAVVTLLNECWATLQALGLHG
jgi:hypothetical protein